MDSQSSEGQPAPKKPRLRGVSHLIAAVMAIPAMLFLAEHAGESTLKADTLTYGICLVLLFAVSALYHVPMWTPTVRSNLRRLDRSMIYVFVADLYPLDGHSRGSYSCLAVSGGWTAGIGIVLSIFFPNLPRFVTAIRGSGGAIVMMPAVMEHLGQVLWLISTGGISTRWGRSFTLNAPEPMA